MSYRDKSMEMNRKKIGGEGRRIEVIIGVW